MGLASAEADVHATSRANQWAERVKRLNDIEARIKKMSEGQGVEVHEAMFHRKTFDGVDLSTLEIGEDGLQKARNVDKVPPLAIDQCNMEVAASLLNARPSKEKVEQILNRIDFPVSLANGDALLSVEVRLAFRSSPTSRPQ